MENLKAIKTIPKNGNEELSFNEINIRFSLLDFWKWSVSDLMSNATRGRLAEFIVGTSVGLNPENLRDEWDAYDITSDNSINSSQIADLKLSYNKEGTEADILDTPWGLKFMRTIWPF